MELVEFKESLLDYYKKHESTYVQNLVIEYVEGNYPEKKLEDLFLSILKSHPYKYGFPDVSAIETAVLRYLNTDDVQLKKKKPLTEHSSSPHIEQLTDDEKAENEKLGFDKSLMEEIKIKAVDNSNVKELKPNCKICEFKPEQTQTGYTTNDNCKQCGSNGEYLRFKQENKKS